jgi:hypothetical protein
MDWIGFKRLDEAANRIFFLPEFQIAYASVIPSISF